MNKFGLLDEEDGSAPQAFNDKLAMFAPIKPRVPVDLAAVDAAAAQHGFVSREVVASNELRHGRRRRAVPSEPTRHLAIRLSASAYDRFVSYADRHQLTYHEALIRLMESVEK